jgi:hypothetical protein
MGHIQDRWYATVKGPAGGKAIRVKTALFGKGLRYKVRYLDPDRSEKSKMYPDRCKKQAEDFLLGRVEQAGREVRRSSGREDQVSEAGRELDQRAIARWSNPDGSAKPTEKPDLPAFRRPAHQLN